MVWASGLQYPLSAEFDDEGLLLCGMIVGPAAPGVTGPGSSSVPSLWQFSEAAEGDAVTYDDSAFACVEEIV